MGIIQQFENRLEEIRKQESSRYTKQLTKREKDLFELISGKIIQKVIAAPVLPLSRAYQRGEGDYFSTTLKNLFDLKEPEENSPNLSSAGKSFSVM